jgi:hypothetical protein
MPRRYYLLLTVITLVGAFLRLWQLTTVPPGLHYDLAATALLGNDVAFNGYRPIFISAYTGHEALFYYWLALWFRLAGSSVFSLRLAAAMLGILAVPATFFATREAMRFEKELSFPLAALAACFLATSFWALVFSRYGFRVISEPVVQALALGFLFKALWSPATAGAGLRPAPARGRLRGGLLAFRRRSTIYMTLSGIFTGLAAYTYLAARLFPIPLAVFWIVLSIAALRRRGRTDHGPRTTIGAFSIFSIAALATFAPLGLYFLNNPQDFLNRASQVAPRTGETALLLTGIRRAAEMLFIKGEPYDRFNIPGQPLFGTWLGLFFVIGLLVTLKNALLGPAGEPGRKPAGGQGRTGAAARPQLPTLAPNASVGVTNNELPIPRATEVLLLVWLPAMLLPTALAVHDIFPSNMRALGLIPLLFVFPARGLLVSYRWVQKRLPGPMIPYAYPLVVVTLAALAFGAYSAGQDNFIIWDRLPNQRQNNDADLVDIATYLNAHDTSQSSVYVSAIHYRHPTLAYLARDFDQLHWLTGGTALVVPEGRPALYLFARSAPPPDEWVAGWEPHLIAAPLDPDGVPIYRAYQFAAGETPPLPKLTPLDENFGNLATLTGYRLITHTDELLLDLRWHIENLPAATGLPAGDYLPYARLTDAWGSGWSQSGGFSYASEQWQPGDTVLTRLQLPMPAGMPPGDYRLTAGVYSADTQQNLPHLDPAGAFAGIRARVASPTLAGGPAATLEAFQAANGIAPVGTASILCALPGNNGALLGSSIKRSTLRQGELLHLALYWATSFTVGDNALTIALGSQTLYTGQPVHGTLPFKQWAANQVLIDRYALTVPADAPPGATPLKLTMSGGRCQASLGAVTVEAVNRVYSPPPVAAQRIAADSIFGDELAALYGYTLSPGQPTRLQLVWKSLGITDQDYSVFVHVLDAASGQMVAQADAEPRGGTYPTSMWQPGEYITDDYHFDLPPGRYVAEVGLYLPENGFRLATTGSDAASLTLPEFELK